jgi:hypothetical protein
MSGSGSPVLKLEVDNSDDRSSDATARESDPEKLPRAEKSEASIDSNSEWTFESCLQVLGGFMCLFNS